jgi:DNA phosphorothioation-dependent restriction protein DptG
MTLQEAFNAMQQLEIDKLKAENERLKGYLNAWSNGWDEAIDEKDRMINQLATALERFQFFGKDPLLEEARKVVGPAKKPNV